MAFTHTIKSRDATAKHRIHHGTFTNTSGSTGGDIETGLEVVEHITFCVEGAAVGNAVSVNETLPCAGNAVTIVTDADVDGTWLAFGR